MNGLITFGLVGLLIYIYLLWIVIKEKRIIHIFEMNFEEKVLLWFNYNLLIISIFLLGIGLYKNYQIIRDYKQNGIYVKGEIEYRSAIGTSSNSNYRIQIDKDGENKAIYVWSSDFGYTPHEIVGLYYKVDEKNSSISAMIEGEKSSEEGDTFLGWSTFMFILSTFIYGYRYDILRR